METWRCVIFKTIILCDWMASYEEKDLLIVLGKHYAEYQSRVPKWLPFRNQTIFGPYED